MATFVDSRRSLPGLSMLMGLNDCGSLFYLSCLVFSYGVLKGGLTGDFNDFCDGCVFLVNNLTLGVNGYVFSLFVLSLSFFLSLLSLLLVLR